MKFSFLTFVIFWVLLAQAQPANAKPIEVKSENFVLVGNLSPSSGKRLIVELEKYRAALMYLFGVEVGPEPIPVRIYTSSGPKGLKQMSGQTGVGGVYTSNIEGPIFLLDSSGGFRRGKSARNIALHEYTHHLLASYTDKFYPRWFNEGYANYLATFEINRAGDMIIGRPYEPYSWPLAASKWMPTKQVVNSIRNYPFATNSGSRTRLDAGDFFYAQTWLAVHFIQSNPGYSRKLANYINLLNQENRPDNLFAEAFGMSEEDFHKKLKAYHKKNSYLMVSVKSDHLTKNVPLQIRNLSKGEALFHKAEAMRYFRAHLVETEDIIKQYKKAAQKLGETPHILSGLAELATWQDDFETANTYMQKALLQAPNDPKINHMAGMILVYKNEDMSKNPNMDELRQARKYLKKALIANPNDISAHFYFAKSYALTSEPPSAQALASAETALDYYRSINFLGSNLMLAGVLLEGKKIQYARPAIDKAIVWGRDVGIQMQAKSMRQYLQQMEARGPQ